MRTEQQRQLSREHSRASTSHTYSSGMERGLILLVSALMAFMAAGVQGTFHLSFANNTEVNITRNGCGVSKLCVETPNDCDPAANSTCLFASLTASTPMAPNGTILSVELRGESMGYIALGLTQNASEGITALFICAQNSSNNGSFFFRTMTRNNPDGMLSPVETIVREIRGMVVGNVIKCEYDIPNVNATSTRTSHSTTFQVLLGNGTFDGSVLGRFNTVLDSGTLNVADPNSNTAATTAPTTAPSNITTTMSGADRPHAVLLLLTVLTVPLMLRA
ncbi:putative ferric-chelate reductase 1 [Acanthopagrus latus]|uniref:putative ferric-chelate reductase 1 n=1 Tax=Acanthopagrus latus TaxID=8177 RepID=UPI00187C82B9|nr:putative ferric-chelate reductase 1 [Acanthopagrus latus]